MRVGCGFDRSICRHLDMSFFGNIPACIGNRRASLRRATRQAQRQRETPHGLVIAKSSSTSLPSPEYALSDNFLPSIVKCT